MNELSVQRTLALDERTVARALWCGARDGVVYASPNEIFIGLGELRSVELGSLRSTSLAALSALRAASSEVAEPLRCFIASPFDPSSPMKSVTPMVQIVSSSTGSIMTCFGRTSEEVDDRVDEILGVLGSVAEPEHHSTDVHTIDQSPSGLGYGEMVEEALTAMADQGISKVVLARSVSFEGDLPLDPAAVLERMREREPTCTLYAFSLDDERRVIGASPELLIAKHGPSVTSHPLAGTLALDEDRDPGALADSIKDLEEHRVVVDEIARGLSPLLESISVPTTPTLVALRSVAHLGTTISGVASITTDGPHVLDLLSAIHPTPAIAGEPVDAAMKLLGELEPFDRGYFGGAFGWIDERGDGEFILGIRGIWLDAARVWLAAGAGIVEGSTPEGERMETLAKLRSILDAAIPYSIALVAE